MIIKDNISLDEAAFYNANLAKVFAIDLEPNQRQQCREYLDSALLMHSVIPCIDASALPGLKRLETELSTLV